MPLFLDIVTYICNMIGQINIKGIIGKDVSLADVISQANKVKEATEYTVILNSVGGSVKVGKEIYNYLKSLGVPINMVGVDKVASIATIVFMAGTTRKVEKGTRFFIHLPNAPQIENATAQDLENYSKELKKIETEVIQFYVENTGITKEGIEPMLKDETFLDSEQLFNMGFTTVNDSIPLEAVAYLDENKFKKKKIMTDTKKEQANKIMTMVAKFFKGAGSEMKMVLTADQKELDFPDLGEDEPIIVDSKATIDGVPAEGEIVLADGRTLVFEAGAVKEIKEASSDSDDDSDEVESLKEEIKTLKASVVANAEKETVQEAKLETVETELKASKKVLVGIQGIQSKMILDDKKEKKEQRKKSKQDHVSEAVEALMDL